MATDVYKALTKYRFSWPDESTLQLGIATALEREGIAFTREYSLNAQDRVDFLVGSLAVEVKIKGSLPEVARQLRRYCEHACVSEVLVVTTRAQHTALPDQFNGKPIRVLHLKNL